MSIRPWALVPFAVLLISCVPIRTRITAYSQAEVAHLKRFRLIGPDPKALGGDPQWPAFSAMLTKALVKKGFVLDAISPELVILVSYRVGDTQTYTSSETTTDANGSTSSSTSTSSDALYSLRVEAIDPASWTAKQPKVLWRTHATLRSMSDDMASLFPYMAASMEDYFAHTAVDAVIVAKRRNDAAAMRLRAK